MKASRVLVFLCLVVATAASSSSSETASSSYTLSHHPHHDSGGGDTSSTASAESSTSTSTSSSGGSSGGGSSGGSSGGGGGGGGGGPANGGGGSLLSTMGADTIPIWMAMLAAVGVVGTIVFLLAARRKRKREPKISKISLVGANALDIEAANDNSSTASSAPSEESSVGPQVMLAPVPSMGCESCQSKAPSVLIAADSKHSGKKTGYWIPNKTRGGGGMYPMTINESLDEEEASVYHKFGCSEKNMCSYCKERLADSLPRRLKKKSRRGQVV